MKMKKNICSLLILSVILLNSVNIFAQFTCSLRSPSEVEVGEAFRISIEMNERPSSQPQFNLQNFEVVAGPSTSMSSSTSFINGKMTSETKCTYTYTLIANKEGSFTIPAITINSKNGSAKTNPVTIKVVKGAARASSSPQQSQKSQSQSSASQQTATSSTFDKKDYFVRASVSNANPYVGEQVIIKYKLYISSQAYGYQASVTSMPSASSCWTYELGDKNAEPKPHTETYNGKQYSVVDIRTIAVYPQKNGEVTISPLDMDMVVQVVVRQQRPSSGDPFFDAFFGGMSQQVQNLNLKVSSNTVNLHVKSLPTAGQPADFSHLVGKFTIKSSLTRDELDANDATNLRITVSGEGNLQYVDAPQLDLPADLDVHEPKIIDNIHTPITGVSGSRTFEYVIIPRNAGKYEIPATEFTYFDKGKGQYVTIATQPYTLKVNKGKASSGAVYSSANKEDIKILGNDIRHIKEAKLQQHYSAFFGTPLYWILLALPIVLLLVLIVLLRKKIKENQNMVLVKDKRAAKTAKKRLKKAEQLLKAGADKEFYIEISQVLWGYVSDKFHIPVGQLSLDTAEEQLLNRQMKPEAIDMFLTTLKDCEYVRFAPSADITPQKMYEKTFRFITEIEKELK